RRRAGRVTRTEIGTLAHAMGADGQEVMRIACRDRQLNVSPAYLRPGFAFGGSCLPKDVRALSRFGQVQALQLQLLHSVLESNTAHIERGLAAIRDTGCRRIGLAGLSFKAGSDDLRESPLVALAELLVGKGYDLRIYDPGVCVSDLVGTNRTFVERHLPHLASLLVREPFELFEHSELLVIGTGVADDIGWKTQFAGETIDLRRDLVAASIPEPQTAFK
ncbi:MAG: UDP binding domain-containing protein, partial [Planctomycetaceae bacterium]